MSFGFIVVVVSDGDVVKVVVDESCTYAHSHMYINIHAYRHGNFWMVMVSGRKRWILFHPDDVALLYPDWSRGTVCVAYTTHAITLKSDSTFIRRLAMAGC